MCFDYDGSPDIFDEREVKCRKPHKCRGCKRRIERGEKALYISSLFDHSWDNYYLCTTCRRIQLAIVVHELEEGCGWSEAWIHPDDMRNYLADLEEPIQPIGMPTIADCRRYVDDLYLRRNYIDFAKEFAA